MKFPRLLPLLCLVSTVIAVDGKRSRVSPKKYSIVSIDTVKLMRGSEEGKTLLGKIQNDVEKFNRLVKEQESKVASLQEEINKQGDLLSEEARREKANKLVKAKKKAEKKIAKKSRKLREKMYQEETKLRSKFMEIAQSLINKKGWGIIIDKAAPGVLAVNDEIDVTEEVLVAANEKYRKDNVGREKDGGLSGPDVGKIVDKKS